MVEENTDNHCTAFTVSIDYKETTTGISAFERSMTAMRCMDPKAKPSDFRRPGHMFPLRPKDRESWNAMGIRKPQSIFAAWQDWLPADSVVKSWLTMAI